MTEQQKFYTPLKIGFLIVTLAYFLFTFHAMFTLQWIGEWDRLGGGGFSQTILVEDINATIGLVFRFAASIIALGAIVYYFVKKGLSAPSATKIFRWILVFEAIYWMGLIATGAYSVYGFARFFGVRSIASNLTSLTSSVIPTLVESIVLPIALFVTAYKLSPNKPMKGAMKWGLITGTIYVLVFWLINGSIWVSTINQKGFEYLTTFPEHFLSFDLTRIGLFALLLFTAYFTKKSVGTETLEKLNLRAFGSIILALGLYFLWNYLTWIFFATDATWSNWYAWFLGHNMDLWLLSLPLVGLPLLFERKASD